MNLSDSAWKDVTVQLKRNGTLNLTYGGQVVYTNFSLPDYRHTYGQFAFGARTGGANARQGIRNLEISTVPQGADMTATITGQPKAVAVDEKGNATFEVGF